jgi:molybdopterin-guanine dinucleotide biosynthesis protein A
MGADKAGLELDGVTLLERAVARLAEVCDPVLIGAGDSSLGVAGHRSIPDVLPDAGPLAGLVAALRASPHPLLAVVAVDLPWLDPGLLGLLADRIGDHDAAVCVTEGGIEPLHAVYARSALGVADAALTGPDRSVRRMVATLRSIQISEAEWRAAGVSDRFSRNLNTPEDLAEVRRALRR